MLGQEGYKVLWNYLQGKITVKLYSSRETGRLQKHVTAVRCFPGASKNAYITPVNFTFQTPTPSIYKESGVLITRLYLMFYLHPTQASHPDNSRIYLAWQAVAYKHCIWNKISQCTYMYTNFVGLVSLTISLTGTSVKLIMLRSSSSPSSLSLRLFLAMVKSWRSLTRQGRMRTADRRRRPVKLWRTVLPGSII